MGLILDTSILIAAEKERLDLESLIRVQGSGAAGIATITASELLHGVERAPAGRRRDLRRQNAEAWLGLFSIHEFGLAEARVHARIGARLMETGQMIGAHDLIIAATCVHLNADLATLNVGEFSRVPGLKLVPIAPYAR